MNAARLILPDDRVVTPTQSLDKNAATTIYVFTEAGPIAMGTTFGQALTMTIVVPGMSYDSNIVITSTLSLKATGIDTAYGLIGINPFTVFSGDDEIIANNPTNVVNHFSAALEQTFSQLAEQQGTYYLLTDTLHSLFSATNIVMKAEVIVR